MGLDFVTMNNRHLIDTAVFDISYGHEEIAFDQQSEIDNFVKNDLMMVVDEVFNEIINPGSVYRIASLEIDLGEIPYDDYQDQMPRKLREKLVSIFTEIRHAHKTGQASNGSVIENKSAEVEQLFYFLLNGHLPWYSRLSGSDALELLLEQTIISTPESFMEFLHNATEQEVVIERLASQFSEEAIRHVIKLLSSSKSKVVQKYKTDLIKRVRKSDSPVNSHEMDSNNLQSEAFSPSEHEQDAEDEHLANSNKLYFQLVSALINGDVSSIQANWSVLYHDHVQLLEKTLRFYGQQAKVRKHIALGFSEEMLNDILVLLEPSEHGFVKTVIDQSELFCLEQDSQSSNRDQHKAEMREFSLGYLLVERGSRFNKKSYLASLIGQIAASRNKSQSVLLINLRENISSLPKSNKLATQVLQFLTEISHDLGISEEKEERKSVEQLESYENYERLKSSLTGEIAHIRNKEAVLLEDIEVLRQKAPWLLMRLYRELQVGAYSWNQTIENYSVPLLRQLVYAFLSLTIQSDSTRQSDFITAIQANAEKSRNQKSFYIYILECLIKGELINFDSIEVESLLEDHEKRDSSKTNIAKSLADQPGEAVVEQVTNEQANKIIVDILYGHQALSVNELAELIRLFDLMLVQQPQVLRQLLESGLNDSKFINRVVDLLPERLHVKLLSRMGIANYVHVLQCAELLSMACYVEETGIQQNQLERLKWQFIYSYIAESGRLFNEKYFVRQYVETLMIQTNLADSQQFRSVLSQQLLQNILPSTREISQSLIKSLSYDADDISTIGTTVSKKPIEPDRDQNNEQAVVEDIYISNAGIVLAAPYLPRLFDKLGLIEKSAFKDRAAAERGVHMLQFLVNESVSSPEYQLVLNKLLCGVKTGQPIRRGIELGAHEKSQIEGLLLGMIQHWKSLGNTSITGLRESFLQRHGRLQLRDDAWHLSVEAKSFDMLLDQIPWAYSTIKFPWMDRVIYVEWR